MNDARNQSTTMLCGVGRLLAELPERYVEAVSRIVNTGPKQGGWALDEASRLLFEAGLKASETSIYLHRVGRCKCARGNSWSHQNSTAS